jgi:hypothetical protein
MVLGWVVNVHGAHNEAMKSYESFSSGGGFNKEAGYILTFTGATIASAIDDAALFSPYGPHVLESWEHNKAGPTQSLVGDLLRALDAWWSRL